MVGSSGSNNCWIQRIEPWLDPPDRTIVGSKGSNHGWILRIEQLLDPKDRTMISQRDIIVFPWKTMIVLLLFEYFCLNPFVLLRKTTKQQTTTIIIVLCTIMISLLLFEQPFLRFCQR